MLNSYCTAIDEVLLCKALDVCRDSGARFEEIPKQLHDFDAYILYLMSKYEPIGIIYNFIKTVIDDDQLLIWWISHCGADKEYIPCGYDHGVEIRTAQDLIDYYFSKRE